jgi:hypothetical protein
MFYKFWITSSRGTDACSVKYLDADQEDEIKYFLENWCQNFGAWTSGDNLVNYGYLKIKNLPRKRELVKLLAKTERRIADIDEQMNKMLKNMELVTKAKKWIRLCTASRYNRKMRKYYHSAIIARQIKAAGTPRQSA